MNNNFIEAKENTPLSLNIGMIIPLLFILNQGKDIDIKSNLKKDFTNHINIMENIKEYFPQEEQHLLAKVQDVFDILNKINRVREDKYENLVGIQNNIPIIEKKERILKEVAKYTDDSNKELINKVVDTKHNIFKTKENIESHKKVIESQKMSPIDSLMMLINCFKPILRDDLNKKIKKVELIIDTLNTPYDKI